MHVAQLGFDSKCSIKGPPNNIKVKELIGHYLVDGFATMLEPLVVTQPAELLAVTQQRKLPTPWKGMDAFSIGYGKGMNRALSLLGLLLVCFDHGIDVKEAGGRSALFVVFLF